MPRPRKAGLDYYYRGVHEWNDIRIMALLQKYGPMGHCIYEVVLSKVYESGYYLEISLDLLAVYVVKTIGNRWIRDKSIALQVIRYCAEIGLFDHALMQQSVITSVNIQQHYAEVTARSKADKSKYWLLDSSEKTERPAAQPDLSAKEVFAAKTEVLPAETSQFPEEMHQSKEKKTKSKKTKAKQSAPSAEGYAMPASAFGNDAAAAVPPEEETEEIEEKFSAITGRRFRQSDRAALEEMYAEGATDSLILYAMGQVASRKNAGISSMRYFMPIVREALRKNKDSPPAAKAAPCGKSERMPETSDISEIEQVLDAEWLSLISQYPPMSDEDYV